MADGGGPRKGARSTGTARIDREHRDAEDVGGAPVLEQGEGPGQGGLLAGQDAVGQPVGRLRYHVAGADQLVDHPGQAESLPVGRGEDVDAETRQRLDLLGHDDPATTAEDAYVACSGASELLDEVAEVLEVAALLGRDRDALDVLLDRGGDHVGDAAVVPEVDDLDPL